MKGDTAAERPLKNGTTAFEEDAPRHKERFLELLSPPSARRTAVLGVIGAVVFFAAWEASHYATPESGQRFLPSVEQVLGKLIFLFAEKGFLKDVAVSCMRIFGSFFVASAIAVPLGIAMGCFGNLKALINPTVSGWRYLPAASFIPLLLVWFGPSETAKVALLFLGVVFFLVAMVLDNTEAVQREFIEAALTMGASRKRIVFEVVVPAVFPAIIDSMRTMIAVGCLPGQMVGALSCSAASRIARPAIYPPPGICSAMSTRKRASPRLPCRRAMASIPASLRDWSLTVSTRPTRPTPGSAGSDCKR